MKMRTLPADERPREKLSRFGVGVLSDAELLALLLGSGTKGKNVIEISRELLDTFGGLQGLCESGLTRARKVLGIGKSKMAILLSLGEICRRVNTYKDKKNPSLFEVAEGFMKRHYEQEECHLLYLDGRGRVDGMALVAKGMVDRIVVTPNDILRIALLEGATRFALLHVHPSGICLPSREDIALTEETARKARDLKLYFHDHLIVSSDGIYSFREQGSMSGKKIQ